MGNALQRLLTGIIAIFIVMVAAWWLLAVWGSDYYSSYGPCGTERVRAAVEEMELTGKELIVLYHYFNKNYKQAGLAEDMVARIKILQDQARDMEAPVCMRGIKKQILSGLENFQESWMLAGAPDYYTVLRGYEDARSGYQKAYEELAKIEQCVPYCEAIVVQNIFP